MDLKKCDFCGNLVPPEGQCNKCGFIDGMRRPPTNEEFGRAREINKKFKYKQFSNLDMLMTD